MQNPAFTGHALKCESTTPGDGYSPYRGERVFVSAGSNVGDRQDNLIKALLALGTRGVVVRKVSSFFETEPVGFREQPWFLNLALEVESHLSAPGLLAVCQELEVLRGRIRAFPGAPRTLDLDILFYGDRVIRVDGLLIPHPRLAERRFVLVPLAQIAPDFIHPLLGVTVSRLLETCTDKAIVRPFTPGDVPR